ncbi:hypothetical protein GCM10022224_098480 [Nonomuraea antimicrobica]|uniref:Regulatory protein, tetR family n=1 Tax=Nonomuraea antimicrobica TaxID=561173 RepID=A0ABP7EBX9_9ACTN
MSRKTFYKYFPSIEAALVYAQKMVLAGMRAEPEPRQERGLNRFLARLRRVIDFTLAHPERMIFLSHLRRPRTARHVVAPPEADRTSARRGPRGRAGVPRCRHPPGRRHVNSPASVLVVGASASQQARLLRRRFLEPWPPAAVQWQTITPNPAMNSGIAR